MQYIKMRMMPIILDADKLSINACDQYYIYSNRRFRDYNTLHLS
jgi:hypothetical protein